MLRRGDEVQQDISTKAGRIATASLLLCVAAEHKAPSQVLPRCLVYD